MFDIGATSFIHVGCHANSIKVQKELASKELNWISYLPDNNSSNNNNNNYYYSPSLNCFVSGFVEFLLCSLG